MIAQLTITGAAEEIAAPDRFPVSTTETADRLFDFPQTLPGQMALPDRTEDEGATHTR